MLNELQPDLRELIELVRQAENYDATMAASALAGTPIAVSADAVAMLRGSPNIYNSGCLILVR